MVYKIFYNTVNKKNILFCSFLPFDINLSVGGDTCIMLWEIFAFMLNVLLSMDLNQPYFSILCRKWWVLNKCLL